MVGNKKLRRMLKLIRQITPSCRSSAYKHLDLRLMSIYPYVVSQSFSRFNGLLQPASRQNPSLLHKSCMISLIKRDVFGQAQFIAQTLGIAA
jgi:hypothetical protein